MQFPQNQTCFQPNPSVTGWCYSGCGQLLPIVPGSNPALQIWNGQNFLVADGSSNNPIFLPALQTNTGTPSHVVGANNGGQLFFYPYAIPTTVQNIAGGYAGNIPWQAAPSVTEFVPSGDINSVLICGGAGSPSWMPLFAIPEPISYTSGSNYTLKLSDLGALVVCNNSSNTTITVPNSSSVSFVAGQQINLLAAGTGQVTVVGSSGVTVNSSLGLKLRTQYSPATVFYLGSNEWVLMGDITP
jgi:hypothetical protein